jgi:hypothetical protein
LHRISCRNIDIRWTFLLEHLVQNQGNRVWADAGRHMSLKTNGRGERIQTSDPLVPNHLDRKSKPFLWCRLRSRFPFFPPLKCTEIVPRFAKYTRTTTVSPERSSVGRVSVCDVRAFFRDLSHTRMRSVRAAKGRKFEVEIPIHFLILGTEGRDEDPASSQRACDDG